MPSTEQLNAAQTAHDFVTQPVQNLIELRAISINDRRDKNIVYVEDVYGNYAFNLQAINVDDGLFFIQPNDGQGRWIRLNPIQPQNLIGALVYRGSWNAFTNFPGLVSEVGNKGDYYVVSISGNTLIDNENNWRSKDWIVFNGTIWEKVDNNTGLFFTSLILPNGIQTLVDTVNSRLIKWKIIADNGSDYYASQIHVLSNTSVGYTKMVSNIQRNLGFIGKIDSFIENNSGNIKLKLHQVTGLNLNIKLYRETL